MVKHPMAKSLILTHIFGKSLDKGISKAEIISISTMAIVLPGSFTKSICKMWVKDRAKSQGLLRSPTCGTYPQGLTWGTSCPVRSVCNLGRKLVGIAYVNDWHTNV